MIDCHRVDLSTGNAADLALLDSEERVRASRFRFERHRSRYVAAHAQLRRLLGARLGIDPARVPLTTTAHGKPVLDRSAAAMAGLGAPDRTLCFNLSHSEAVGYLAIAPCDVGIDVELARPLADLQPLIDSYCSRAEIATLAAMPGGSRAAGFLRVWTRKEAALKAWGTGIGAVPLNELHVGIDSETVPAMPGPIPYSP
jgi:4'-phosphopantetheinyl transferase